MKINKEETLRAIDESIKHWQDNVRKLENARGRFVNNRMLEHIIIYNELEKTTIYYNAKHPVLIYYNAKHCALCRLNIGCENCILAKYGYNCMKRDSTWRGIENSKTQAEALKYSKEMLRILKKIKKEEEK